MPKKIVVYFRKKTGQKDPFSTWKNKRETYHAMFRAGCAKGLEMYFVPTSEHYLGDLAFKDPYKYNPDAGEFSQIFGEIDADAIYDRSGGLQFPPENISNKVLNSRAFKALCADKNLTYKIIGDFMPKTFRIRNLDDLTDAMGRFSPDEIIVFKPADGLGGRGVIIRTAEKLRTGLRLEPGKEYCLQEFVDTSGGIPGITDGRHDMRIVVVNGEMVLAHIRTPKQGAFLANVAQGGSMREVDLSIIPEKTLVVSEKIRAIIDKKYDKPIYSIDFGIDNDEPYVFELNDQIGFPTEDMGYERFIGNIIDSLMERACR